MMVHCRMLPLLWALVFISYLYPACSFATKSESLVAMRRRALMKGSGASNAQAKPTQRKKNQQVRHIAASELLSKSFLFDVIKEALFRQNVYIEALDREVDRKKLALECTSYESASDGDQQITTEEESNNSPEDTAASRIEARKEELGDITMRLRQLRSAMEKYKGQISKEKLEQIRLHITSLGHGSIFKQPQSAWKSTKALEQEFGRPQGFDGQVFYSPLGVPILVGRMNAHKDDTLRNAAQGSDLWFQVEDYNGSRVLLRTSLMRGTQGSKKCRQMAANIAAKYSVWGEDNDSIPVMYTDSRKVAKRGSKVGSMKKSKSLGRILGYPQHV